MALEVVPAAGGRLRGYTVTSIVKYYGIIQTRVSKFNSHNTCTVLLKSY